jgi:tetratricopeptide (TPR) repeat protein
VAQIAEELGVNHVLEGSVRKAGNRVRVTAQLIEAANGFHLWSETYDRELTDIFAIQDEIAQAIAAAMKVQLLPAAANSNLTGTTSIEAYEYYLQGSTSGICAGEALRTPASSLKGGGPIPVRPAHAYLALTWGILPDYSDIPIPVANASAREAAETALALDPASIEAATALIYSSNEVTEQLEYAKRAVALNAGFPTTHQWYGTGLVSMGDMAGAEREYRLALELDPRSRIIAENLAILLQFMGRFDEALGVLSQLASFAPEYARGPEMRFQIHLVRGEWELAEAAGNELARLLQRKRNTVPVYLDLFFAPEQRAAAVAEIVSWPLGDWWNPDSALIHSYDLVPTLAAAGAHDEALKLLEWLYANEGSYTWANIRVIRYIPDFLCSADVQAFFASTNLPPLIEPYPCPP